MDFKPFRYAVGTAFIMCIKRYEYEKVSSLLVAVLAEPRGAGGVTLREIVWWNQPRIHLTGRHQGVLCGQVFGRNLPWEVHLHRFFVSLQARCRVLAKREDGASRMGTHAAVSDVRTTISSYHRSPVNNPLHLPQPREGL